MYYGTPPIVTNGLVLNLDAQSPQSIPNDPTVNQAQSPFVFTAGYAYVNVTASNNTTINYDGTLTAGTLSTPQVLTYYARTSGYNPPIAYGKKYATSWLLKYANVTNITLNWGGIHSGNRTNFNFNLQTGVISGVSLASGENYGSYDLGNGWYQVWYTSTTPTTGSNLYYPQLGLTSGSVFIGGIQIEMNNYATPFTPSSRTSWQDISGNNNTATLLSANISGSIPVFPAANNRVLQFDGTSSFASVNSPWSYLSSSATEVFFSANAFGISTHTPIAGYDQNDNTNFSNSVVGMIYISNSDRKIRSSVITTTQVYRQVISNTVIQSGSYYHVVLNKDTTNGALQLYVNGILESTTTFDTGSYAQWPALGTFKGSNIIKFSNTLSSNPSFDSKYLNGTIPVFRLYNKILSQAEITQNYNALKSRFGLQ
jgi:hypothetical protein